MSFTQKIGQVIALSCLISGAIIVLNNQVASARSILHKIGIEIFSQISTLIYQRRYSVKILSQLILSSRY